MPTIQPLSQEGDLPYSLFPQHGGSSLQQKDDPLHGLDDALALRVSAALTEARTAQPAWGVTALSERLAIIRRARQEIARCAARLAATASSAERQKRSERLVAEVLPLADACRFLEREAPQTLAPQRPSARSRPWWLRGVELTLHREPLGVILIVAPSNYPLFLPGVQTLQALTAGNAVLIKPGDGGTDAALALAGVCAAAGLDPRLLHVLPESPAAVRVACAAGVDKVLFTGSSAAGKAVLRELTPSVTPAVCELSGCDAVFVRADADLDLVVDALRFGLQFNGGATCIAPRRVFAHQSLATALADRLASMARALPTSPLSEPVAKLLSEAIAEGARVLTGRQPSGPIGAPVILADAAPTMRLLQTDLFAPILALVRVDDDDAALNAAAACPYALGAAIFGETTKANALAARVRAGVVVINDVIIPTADPRLPFGGRGSSGFGVTRGAAGLLELTTLKAITVRTGRWRPHLQPPAPQDEQLFRAYIMLAHGGGLLRRLRACAALLRAMATRRPEARRVTMEGHS